MIIDIEKPIYCIDKETGKKHKVTAIFFPMGSVSGKDVIIEMGCDTEWRSIEEVELINNVF